VVRSLCWLIPTPTVSPLPKHNRSFVTKRVAVFAALTVAIILLAVVASVARFPQRNVLRTQTLPEDYQREAPPPADGVGTPADFYETWQYIEDLAKSPGSVEALARTEHRRGLGELIKALEDQTSSTLSLLDMYGELARESTPAGGAL